MRFLCCLGPTTSVAASTLKTVDALAHAGGLFTDDPVDGRHQPRMCRRNKERGCRTGQPALAHRAILTESVEAGLSVVGAHAAAAHPTERRSIHRGVQQKVVARDAAGPGVGAEPAKIGGI